MAAVSKSFSFKLNGMEQLIKNLEQLPTVSMRKTVVRNAIKKSLEPVRDLAKANVPRDDGALADSIHIDTKLKASQKRGRVQDRTTVTVYVGASAPHAHLVEFGTAERFPKKGPFAARISPTQVVMVDHMGRMPANPFLRNAWDSMRGRVLKIFAAQMEVQLMKAARRLAKRAEKGKLTPAMIRGLSK
jgi:HK97 gp10 family phage protein